jgi:hypothetical protein
MTRTALDVAAMVLPAAVFAGSRRQSEAAPPPGQSPAGVATCRRSTQRSTSRHQHHPCYPKLAQLSSITLEVGKQLEKEREEPVVRSCCLAMHQDENNLLSHQWMMYNL